MEILVIFLLLILLGYILIYSSNSTPNTLYQNNLPLEQIKHNIDGKNYVLSEVTFVTKTHKKTEAILHKYGCVEHEVVSIQTYGRNQLFIIRYLIPESSFIQVRNELYNQ